MTHRGRLRRIAIVAACAAALAVVGVGPPGMARNVSSGPSSIDEDTTWSPEGNPHVLAGTVTVGAGALLTIEPGVEVHAEAGAQLVAEGRVEIAGDEGHPVTFRPSVAGTAWRGLVVRGAGSQASSISGAVFRRAEVAVAVRRGTAAIATSRFVRNGVGVALHNPADPISISQSTFVKNRTAVGGRSRNDVTIAGNDFWDNTVNVFAKPQKAYDCGDDRAQWSINENDILRGPASPFFSHDVRTPAGSSGSPYRVDATGNWWGTTDAQRIAARLTDGETGPTDGERQLVEWDPPADAPHTSWTPPGATGDPEPEPYTVADQGTLSYIDSPQHTTCRSGRIRASGRATGVLRELRSIRLALARRRADGACAWWTAARRFEKGRCRTPNWFRPEGLSRWTYDFGNLPRGRYRLMSRSNAEDYSEPARNDVKFRVT